MDGKVYGRQVRYLRRSQWTKSGTCVKVETIGGVDLLKSRHTFIKVAGAAVLLSCAAGLAWTFLQETSKANSEILRTSWTDPSASGPNRRVDHGPATRNFNNILRY